MWENQSCLPSIVCWIYLPDEMPNSGEQLFQSLFSYHSQQSQFYCPQETPDSNCSTHIFNVGSRLKCNNKLSDSYWTSFSSLINSVTAVSMQRHIFISFSCSLLSVPSFYDVVSETNHTWFSHPSLLSNHHKLNIISLKVFFDDPPLSAFSKILEKKSLRKLEKDKQHSKEEGQCCPNTHHSSKVLQQPSNQRVKMSQTSL